MSVLGVVGAGIGMLVPGGGLAAAALGFSIGNGVDALINPQQIEGPRLDDLEVQMASYGNPIPFEYGTNRHAGTIIWPKIIELDEHSETESAKGGPEQKTYSYSASFAVLICEGPIAGVRRIWANKKIIYDLTGESDTNKDPAVSGLRFYTGTQTAADPLIEAKDGPSPAYLGYAYCVFEDLDLTDFANRPPQLEFEVLTIGSDELPDPTPMGAAGSDAAIDPNTGYTWSVTGFIHSHFEVYVTDNATQSLVKTIRYPETGTRMGASQGDSICYVASTNEFWVTSEEGEHAVMFDADTMTQTRSKRFSILPRICVDIEPPLMVWTGLIRYDPVHDLVLIAQTNVATRLSAVRPRDLMAADPCDSSKTIELSKYPVWVTNLPTASNAINFLAVSPATGQVLAITDRHVVVVNGATGQVMQDVFSEYINQVDNDAAYDTERNRLIVVSAHASYLLSIDAATGILTRKDYVLPADAPDDASIAFDNILYHRQNDRYYVTAHIGGQAWTLYTINPDSMEIETVRTYNGPISTGTMLEVPGETGYFGFTDNSVGTGLAWRIPLGTALEPAPVNLGAIVADICKRAGLSASDIDVSQLTDDVDGYIVPRQMSARAAIEPLQTAFFFDAVESDNKLKFVKRGAGTPITIPMEDRAARDFGSDLPDSLSIVRAQDMELPVQVDVEYADIDADHLVGNQYARRITKDTKSRVNIQSPVVMNATKGKQVADVTLYRAWLNQSYKFTTTRKWAHLEPTDIVILPTLEASYTARIVSKREQPGGVIEWEAAMEGVEVYAQSGAGAAPTNYIKQSIYAPGATNLQLLDIPMLRDEDNNAGFYDAMAGTGTNWTGAQLFKSADGGSTYEPVHIIGDPATIGTAQSALPDFAAGNIVDEGSSVTVVMSPGRTLTSVSDTQLFNGANLAVIGAPDRWEVVQFRAATLISANTYQLSGFLRGRRGTEWATGTHQAGDKFIVASLTGWNRVVTGADVGLERKYKAPAFRMPLSSAPATTFTNGAVGLKPFAPVDLTGERDGAGNLMLKWNRRTRMATGTLHMPAPLGEAVEAYSIDIMSGETVLRTLTSSTPSVVYSAADQTADGITPGAAVTASVYQLSQAVGRGYPLKGTV
jgi:hypothetical protein